MDPEIFRLIESQISDKIVIKRLRLAKDDMKKYGDFLESKKHTFLTNNHSKLFAASFKHVPCG